MEYSTEKKTYTGVILAGAILLAIGAAVIYFLIISPSLNNQNNDGSSSSSSSSGSSSSSSSSGSTDDDDDIFNGGASSSSSSSSGSSSSSSSSGSSSSSSSSGGTGVEDVDGISWTLGKTGTVTCANDAETLADVSYTITLSNTGTDSGLINEIVDSLATIVDSEMVTNISSGGVYSDTTGQITWNNSGTGYTIAGGESRTFTYKVRFDKDLNQFTAVENDVTAEPGDGSLPPVPAEKIINVGCDIPDTAIGDEDFLIPSLIITGSLFLIAFLEFQFGLFGKLLGEERMDNLKLAIGSEHSKEIVEKRIKERLKSNVMDSHPKSKNKSKKKK